MECWCVDPSCFYNERLKRSTNDKNAVNYIGETSTHVERLEYILQGVSIDPTADLKCNRLVTCVQVSLY